MSSFAENYIDNVVIMSYNIYRKVGKLMEKMEFVQARTPESVKENAINILEKLGLNMSTYINMSLNQLIIQGGIPFPVKLNPSSYSAQEEIDEVEATLKLEGMHLTEEDIFLLKAYKSGRYSSEEIRNMILNEV